MRIAFAGSVDFSRHCLERLISGGGNVVAVISPHAEHARSNADYADLALTAFQNQIPFRRFVTINDPDLVAYLRRLSPDVIFVFGLSQLLRPSMLSIPHLGVIGAHPTLLPEGRGRHPLIWALVKGMAQTGLSFFYMDEGADSGDILWQKACSIGPDDDAAALYKKIKDLASEAISDFLPKLVAGTAPRRPQDHSRATVWPKRSEKDGEIDWSRPMREIYNLVRALTNPYVGAHTFFGMEKLTVWKCRPGIVSAEPAVAVPGTVLSCRSNSLIVRTGDGTIEVTDWNPRAAVDLRNGAVLGRSVL